MAELAPVLKQRFFDANGAPLNGGLLYTYAAGTSTNLATYTDQTGLTSNANPVVLDSAGYANVWLNSAYAYKFILRDSAGNLIFTEDNVNTTQLNAFATSKYNLTDGQAPTSLAQENFDSNLVSSVEYMCEVKRGTQLIVNMRFVLQWLAGPSSPAWIVVLGEALSNGNQHGLTFTITTIGTVGQLLVACNVGYGNGTIKLKKVTYAT